MASGKALLGQDPVRMLLVGYPGGGKTGSIAALANAGFKVRVLDFEGNYQAMLQHTAEDKLANVDIVTFQDKLMQGAQYIEPAGIPTAFNGALTMMKAWKYKEADGTEVDLGASREWGPDTVVVVDSLTAMGESAMRRAMKMMNKTPGNLTSAVWGAAVTDQVNFIKLLTAMANRYHLIVLGHLQMISPEDFLKQGDDATVKEQKLEAIADNLIPTRLYPKAVTKNLSTIIHKEFPAMVLAERRVKLGKTVRELITTAGNELDLKFPAKDAPASVPIADGLARLFAALGAHPPKE